MIELEGTPGNYTIATTRTQKTSVSDINKVLKEANAASR